LVNTATEAIELSGEHDTKDDGAMKKVLAAVVIIMLLCLSEIAQTDVFKPGLDPDGTIFKDLETVTVGNLGNAGKFSGVEAGGYDPDWICGMVRYIYTIGSAYCQTDVGAFENFGNAYGTFDQGGNDCERNETIASESLNYPNPDQRGGSQSDVQQVVSVQASTLPNSPPTSLRSSIRSRVLGPVNPPIYSINNRAAYDPIMSIIYTSPDIVYFKVWGRVTILNNTDSFAFTVDDGSGMPVTVFAPEYSGSLQTGDYASAWGAFGYEKLNEVLIRVWVLKAQTTAVVKLD
jgi:hypothetical protein